MDKATGFLDVERKNAGYRPVEERRKDYREVIDYMTDEEISKQAVRCMDCGIPYCHAMGCPVFNLIPEWNDYVYQGNWKFALYRLMRTNSLPEITGRICPAPCEASCTLSINSSPVTIKQIELAIIERGFKEGWVVPRVPEKETGKKVAVVGSGPAGMAAAQFIRRAGHTVTLYERSPAPGGILRYGIPDFKLNKKIIDRRVDLMKKEGVNFECCVSIGQDISAKYLKEHNDAVVLAMGAGQPRDLPVPGRNLEGIFFAMDYLIPSNQFVAGEKSADSIPNAKGRKVLVIGGGDTGSDCVGTANRQGAESVMQFEIMPEPPENKETFNPEWPYWPSSKRTSSSHEEGCERRWGIATKAFRGDDGKVSQADFIKVEWSKVDGQWKMTEVPGSEFSCDADLVLLAMGFVHVEHGGLLEELGVSLDERRNINTDENYTTNVEGVFAAGDADIGASLVVRAIFHGQEAAHSVIRYLELKNI